MNNIQVFPESKLNAHSAALLWLNRGIRPVPLIAKSKRPSGGEGWNKVKITEPMIVDYFRKNSNIGGLWGKPSNWLIDIDIDSDEACRLAPLLLPETLIYGRRERPNSHYIYRCRGVENSKFRSKEFSTIVEIRSTGSQSVLPPSLHPEGDVYELNHDTDFFTVKKTELTRYVSELAAATLFVKRYPDEGARHDYVHAMSGALLYLGWKPDKVRTFMEAVLSVVDGESDKDQRRRTIANTVRSHARGNKVYGWKTLENWIPEDEITSMRVWLRTLREVEITNHIPTPKIKKETPQDKKLEFNPVWLQVPGMVGEIMKVSSMNSRKIQPLFDLSSAIASMALIAANRYEVQETETALNPYILMLAPPAGGKGSPLSIIQSIAYSIGMEKQVFSGFQSYHAMMDLMSQSPNVGVWVLDELARYLKGAQSSGSPDHQVITHVNKLYGMGNGYVAGMPARKNPIADLRHPAFTILAASQPKPLSEAISQQDLHTGFLSRFVLFDGGNDRPAINEKRQSIRPASIVEFHNTIKALPTPSGNHPFIPVKCESNDVYFEFQKFFKYTIGLSYDGSDDVWGRAYQNSLIFAGLVAVGVNPKKPRITFDMARWAIDLISWSCRCWEARLSKGVSSNRTESNSKKVEETIFRIKEYSENPHYRQKQRELLSSGWMPRSVLVRECRYIQKRDLDEILGLLEEMEQIEIKTADGHDVYRPKY